MTTAECWAAITALLAELKNRIKNREDIEFFHKLEARYKDAQDCQRKEISELNEKHTAEKSRLAQEIADLRSKLDTSNKPRAQFDTAKSGLGFKL